MTPNDGPVAVIGGGIAGVTTVLSLLSRNYTNIDLYESSPNLTSSTSSVIAGTVSFDRWYRILEAGDKNFDQVIEMTTDAIALISGSSTEERQRLASFLANSVKASLVGNKNNVQLRKVYRESYDFMLDRIRAMPELCSVIIGQWCCEVGAKAVDYLEEALGVESACSGEAVMAGEHLDLSDRYGSVNMFGTFRLVANESCPSLERDARNLHVSGCDDITYKTEDSCKQAGYGYQHVKYKYYNLYDTINLVGDFVLEDPNVQCSVVEQRLTGYVRTEKLFQLLEDIFEKSDEVTLKLGCLVNTLEPSTQSSDTKGTHPISVLSTCRGSIASSHSYDAVIVSASVASVPLLKDIDPDLMNNLISVRGNGIYGQESDDTPIIQHNQRGRAVVFEYAGQNRRAAYSRATSVGKIKIWGGLFVNASNTDMRPPYNFISTEAKDELFAEDPAPVSSKILYEANVPMESCVRPVPSIGSLPLIKRFGGEWENIYLNTGYGFNGYDLSWFSSNCVVSMMAGAPSQTCLDAQFAYMAGDDSVLLSTSEGESNTPTSSSVVLTLCSLIPVLFMLGFVLVAKLARKRTKANRSAAADNTVDSIGKKGSGCARRDFAELQYISALLQTQRSYCPPAKFLLYMKRLSNKESKRDPDLEKSAQGAFEAIDKNGDGFLQKEELRRALGIMVEQGEIELGNNITVLELAEKLMQDFDKDGNGELDIDEFMTLIRSSHFDGLVNIGCSKVRRDCSITDIDLQLFLRSRYNIIVGLNEIRQTILPGLTMPLDMLPTKFEAGFGDNDSSLASTNTKIDLVELVAMLTMPVLLRNMRSKYHREGLMKTQQSRALSFTKQDLDESLRVPEPASSSDDIIKQVLWLILKEVGINISSATADNDSDQYPILTPGLLKKILCQFGEKSLAQDDVLVEDMMKVVRRGSTSFGLERKGRTDCQSIRLTPSVFCRLLTSDILVWQNATHSNDITHNNIEKFKTFQFSTAIVDSTANLFNRKSILLLLWVFMAMFFVSDWVSGQTLLSQEEVSYLQAGTLVSLSGISCPNTHNDGYHFGCTLWQQIATWLLRSGLIVLLGLVVVWGGSLGNGLGFQGSERGRGGGKKALSVAVLILFGIFPVLYAAISSGMTSELFWYSQFVSFAAVVAAIVIYMKSSIPTRNDTPWLGAKARNEQIMEQASCAKMMEGMISNALELHNNASKKASQDNIANVVMQFQALSSKEINEDKAAKSIAVCWKRFFSGDLFEIDGIQISARLLAINVVQVVMSVLIVLVGAKVTRFAVAAWEEGRAGTLLFGLVFQAVQYVGIDLDPSQLGRIVCDKLNTTESMANFISSTSFDMNTCETMSQVAVDAISERASSILYPLDKNMIFIPLIATTVIGAIYTVFLAIVFIPSVVSTTMRFRSGTIPLFDSANNFLVYRERLDRPLELVGTMLWCTVLGPILFGAFFGVFLFLMLWQVTRGFMLRLIASIIGIGITFCIRWAFGIFYVDTTLRGFYRERVNQHNLCGLAVECVMIGLGIALAVFRALVCISISLIYIARADRNLFESDVTIGFGHPLLRTRDHLPVSFRKEILLQEAHHHPHIEVLGKAYLLKLQHGNGFSTRAGCCMRLIFVQALMPWLRQYREMVREQDAVMKIGKTLSKSSSFDRRLSVTTHSDNEEMLAPIEEGETKLHIGLVLEDED